MSESNFRIETTAEPSGKKGTSGCTTYEIGGDPLHLVMSLVSLMASDIRVCAIILAAADAYKAGIRPNESGEMKF